MEQNGASLEISLFGPFAARVGGAPLPHLRSRRDAWLLALLVLRGGRDVERSWLAGMLWPESEEAVALGNLRRCLTDLRRVLGAEAVRLRSPTRHTLCFDLAGAAVDVIAFDAAIRQGETSALERAVALYRGPLLEGCGEEWVFQERQAREVASLGALEMLAARAEERGDAATAERYLRRVVAANPLQESAQRALIALLAGGGNFAAALQSYRELSLRLHRELNTAPDAATTALFQRIRTEVRSRATAPPPSLSRAASPAIRSRASERALNHNLPRQLTRFIGREEEMAEVQRLLTASALLTLTGSGGCGKTRLALRVAADLLDEYPDGAWLVELAPLSDPSLVLPAVAAVLSVREQPGCPLRATLAEHLAYRSLLLILDNAEHLLPACAQLTDVLLRGCPSLRILATSREGLGIAGEQIYRVPSLASPDPRQLPPLERFSQFAAVQLFVDRARLHHSTFAVTTANAPALALICNRLDGIPLAIELASACVKTLPVEKIAERLDDCLRLLTGSSRTALPRHQTLRALIDWSYDLLREPEQALLRRLAVFAGGWTLEAAEGVCAFGASVESTLPFEEGQVLDLLTTLIDKSLVFYEERDGEARYWLLSTLREYGCVRLRQSGETEAAQRRHAHFFLSLAEQAEPRLLGLAGTEQKEWLGRFDREMSNFRAALSWFSREGEPDAGLRLAVALGRLWDVRGYWREGQEVLERALERGAGAPVETRAKALSWAGHLAHRQGGYERAEGLLGASLTLCRQTGDRGGIATSLTRLGSVALWQGRNDVARRYYEDSLVIQREDGDQRGIARVLVDLGLAAWCQGDNEAADRLYEESLTINRKIGSTLGVAASLGGRGFVAWVLGDYTTAHALFEESLAQRRQIGDKRWMSVPLVGLGHVAYAQGEYREARASFEASLEVSREIGDRRSAADGLEGLAQTATAEGETGRAARLFGAAEALREAIGAPMLLPAHAQYNRSVASVRATLDAKAFSTAWAEGRAMTLHQAVAFALREGPYL